MADAKQQAEQLKTEGNAALQGGKVKEAIDLYTKAIELDEQNHVLYSNRSAAYCKAEQYDDALTDAEKCVELKPDWVKGHLRTGQAFALMSRHEEAVMAYDIGLKYDPNSEQLKNGIKESKSHLTGPGGSQNIGNPFQGPGVMEKLAADPRTAAFMADPSFKETMMKIQTNPQELGKHMMDQRIMTAFGVLLGVDINMMGGDGGGAAPPRDTPMDTQSSQPKQREEKMETEQSDSLKQALEAKAKGNAAYKAKKFEEALEHYNKAQELDPANIVFRNNKAAVYFEQGKLEECIKECENAVDVGRENRADYKLIAKAFARIGNAYKKMDKLDEALKYYNKSLSEHRDAGVRKLAGEIEKEMKEKERLAYINPEKAVEEKNKGNEHFTKGDYPTALKFYSEAIKRNPEDPKLYSNRAACYTKLAEFSMALRDCDECIRLDPKFIKGFLRKGNILLGLKENSKASEAYQKALDLDPNCQEAIDGYRKAAMSSNTDPESVRKQAMQDPEIQQILADPAMQLILQQMQKDPRALQEHLKNPEIAKKIEKLLESGLIAIR